MELTILSSIELIKYILAFHVFFQKGLKIKVPCLIVYFIVVASMQEIAAHFYGNDWIWRIILLTDLAIPVFCVKGKLAYNILEYVLIKFGIAVVDILADSMLYAFLPELKNHNLANLASFVLLSILCFRRANTQNDVQLSLKQYGLLFLGLLGSIALLAYFQILLVGDTASKTIISRGYMASACVCTAYMATNIYQIITFSKADSYRRQTETYELYMKLQEQQTDAIIQNGKQQRAFRHDIQAHFWAVHELAKERNHAALEAYLDKLQEQLSVGVHRYTNHTAVDAVIAHIMQTADTFSVRLRWHGEIPQNNAIEIFDWCVLVSNLLTNALEACQQIEADTTIDARLYTYYKNICLKIQNPVKQDMRVTGNQLPTTKQDKANHGYGSYNVKKIVEKYQGEVHYSCENLVFTAELFMQNPDG